MAEARDARREAQAILGPGLEPRLLEPAPPAISEPPDFTDDPAARGEVANGHKLVSPTASGDVTWDEWLAAHPERRDWAAERWLGARRRLGSLPPNYVVTRNALHGLATHVLTPARFRDNGKIGLRYTKGGFGTPFYGRDEQVRVEGTTLIVQRGDAAESKEITTVANAAALAYGSDPDLGWVEALDLHDPPKVLEAHSPLTVDEAAAAFVGDWFGFGWSVLEELRADSASVEASRVQLWPEHFDPAFECGSNDLKRRASFGASPGDGSVNEPYLYVSLWYPDDAPRSELWNAEGFKGAMLRLSGFVSETDQVAAALDWFRAARDELFT